MTLNCSPHRSAASAAVRLHCAGRVSILNQSLLLKLGKLLSAQESLFNKSGTTVQQTQEFELSAYSWVRLSWVRAFRLLLGGISQTLRVAIAELLHHTVKAEHRFVYGGKVQQQVSTTRTHGSHAI